MKLSEDKAILGLKITVPLLVALISFFLLSNIVSSQKFVGKLNTYLDNQKEIVMKLTASSTSVSVGISALPGDIATPIAEKFADLSLGFVIVLCAIYLEKFVVAVSGLIVFKWLIPIACVALSAGMVLEKQMLRNAAYKIMALGAVLFLIVPISVSVSTAVESVYGDTINQTIESAEASAGLMQEGVSEEADENAGNGLKKIFDNLKSSGDSIARGASEYMRYLEKLLSRFIEAVALMVVISCIIPILVIVLMLWVLKMIFAPGLDISGFKLKGNHGNKLT